MKKALIFGIKPTWDKSNLPSLLFAKYLREQNYEVTYVFDPMSIFHLWKWRNEKQNFLKTFILSFTSSYLFNNIECLTSFKLFPKFYKNKLYNFLEKHFNIHYKSKKMNMIYKIEYDLCWSSSYRQIDDFIKIYSKIKIFSVEDNPYGFTVFDKKFLDYQINILKNENIQIFSTSKLLIQDIFQNAIYYSNGIAKHFLLAQNKNLKRNPKKCIYVGAIEEWFDWDTVNLVFSQLAEEKYTLDIYGFSNENVNKKITSNNIHFMGSIKNTELPNILQKYGTGIIPFKNNTLIKYVNPIKLYEYFSCGLNVISSNWDELTLIKNTTDTNVYLYQTMNEFITLLKTDISEEQRHKNILYAKELLYENSFDRILIQVEKTNT